MQAGIYKRRAPERTDLYKIVFNYHEEYESQYAERYEPEYGCLRNIIRDVIYKYLDCGILEHGFAGVYCKKCGKDFFVLGTGKI